MPRGPKGEKRPADVIGAAVMVGRIATGEITNDQEEPHSAADAGRKGGHKRAQTLSSEKRKEIAQKAARSRWHQKS